MSQFFGRSFFIDLLSKLVRSDNTSKILIAVVVATLILALPFSIENAAAQVSQPPVANPVSATTSFNTPTDITIVPTFASDPDGDTVTVTGVSPTTTQGGTVSINLDGKSVHYVPPLNFVGIDTFGYAVTDTAGLTASNNANIIDNNGFPQISISSVTQPDGSGPTTFNFIVSLSGPSTQPISVHFATADDTAKSGIDYTSTSGTLTFPPGTTTETIPVTVLGDTIVKPDKTFIINLSSPTNAVLNTPQGVGTILNDDFPSISINDVTAPDGSSGMTPFVFTVSLNTPNFQDVTVDFTTQDGTATVANGDYTATSGKLTFHPGTTTETITVSVHADNIFKPVRTFFVNLANPTNAVIGKPQGIGTILNDDLLPTLSISDANPQTGPVGNVNEGAPATFIVSLSAPTELTVTVNYATADSTAKSGIDYVSNAGTLIFIPKETTKSITVTTITDTFNEPTETFFVNLLNPTNAVISKAQGVGIVINPIPTTTVATSSPNPSFFGQQVTFTAKVSPTFGSGMPTGTVTFFDGSASTGTQLGVGTLDATSKASITTLFSFGATHDITAVYSGDGNFNTSTSPALVHVVLTPAQAIGQLINLKESMHLDKGITTSLDAKLNAALSSLNSGNNDAAKNQLSAFIHEVNAQTGKKITITQQSLLVDTASAIQLTIN